MQRVAHGTVFEPVALDDLQQRSALTVGHVLERYFLLTTGYLLVERLEQRYQLFYECPAPLVYLFTVGSHLLLPDGHQFGVGFLVFHFQQRVTLLHCLVIAYECFDIDMVQLRDDDVHQSAALLAASVDEQRVAR